MYIFCTAEIRLKSVDFTKGATEGKPDPEGRLTRGTKTDPSISALNT